MPQTINTRKMAKVVLYLIGLILLYCGVIFSMAYVSGVDMGTWVWNRHQNLFSWYSRPLFIIPAAYYAYRQKIWHVAGFMGLMATSLFWFDAPTIVPAGVSEYLEWEKTLFLTNDSAFPLLLLTTAVIIFLVMFFYAFWKRNVWMGLALINAGTVIKVVVSIMLGKEAGMAAIIPSLSSLLAINLVAWIIWQRVSLTKLK